LDSYIAEYIYKRCGELSESKEGEEEEEEGAPRSLYTLNLRLG